MQFACLDLEGVLVPEIWIGLAERTGIDALRATTRDVADYDALMRMRLDILDRHGLGIGDLEAVVAGMEPLAGAKAFLDWLRRRCQVAILSDTFYELAAPLMARLDHPLLLCHRLRIGADGRLAGYSLRQRDAKRRAVEAFRGLGYRIVAVGDSYNDLSMLAAAEAGILFRPPANVACGHGEFPVCRTYEELRAAVGGALAGESFAADMIDAAQ